MNEETKRLVEGAEARANATTRGRWIASGTVVMTCPRTTSNDDAGFGIATTAYADSKGKPLPPNAEFIAHAHQDVPALCAAVREIDAERNEAIKLLTAISQGEYLEGTSAGCAVDDFLARLKP